MPSEGDVLELVIFFWFGASRENEELNETG